MKPFHLALAVLATISAFAAIIVTSAATEVVA
jgi:hypothetical protein